MDQCRSSAIFKRSRMIHRIPIEFYSVRCSATMINSDCTERRKQQQQLIHNLIQSMHFFYLRFVFKANVTTALFMIRVPSLADYYFFVVRHLISLVHFRFQWLKCT